ncbi:MAG: asparagine synthase (glutamine-hydrolyzing) [bacterium]|nr:asparagine synthase (glutamine-hydrolyzing) [bacterium]
MCGICGKLLLDGTTPKKDLILKMCDTIRHRGPDDEGVYIGKNIGLGHRRLSIIDLSTGHQPLSNEDDTIWIVFNGEIYNFQEIRPNLISRGHRFKTKTDTETVIHLYEEYGVDCVQHLRGMFAFAIWDEPNKRLFLARDRIGKKPLCYSLTRNSFVFASELKAILEDIDINKEINLEAIHHYLTYQYVPSPLTIFTQIKKLPPGHIMVVEDGKLKRLERYWRPEYKPKTSLSEPEIIESILEILKEATRIRLISDVPLGAFLSGGIDSSAIVAMMSQLMNEPVKTFSIGFPEASFNELSFARIIADRFKTEHHEKIVKPDALDILPKIVWHYDEPYADSSCIPTYYLSQMTRQKVIVALNGDGGDETFAGYERYVAYKLTSCYEKVPKFIRDGISASLKAFPESSSRQNFIRKAKRFTEVMAEPNERRYIRWLSIFSNEMKERIYSEEMKERMRKIDSVQMIADSFKRSGTDDLLDTLLFVDTMNYLPFDLMVKVDIASMAHSLECRSPFLDHKLVEFAASIPSNLKLKGGETKHILKKALAKILPKEILNRGKMGFGVPLSFWFREELKDYAQEILLCKKADNRGYFEQKEIKNLLKEHISGRTNHSYRIFSLLMLELWHQTFVDK